MKLKTILIIIRYYKIKKKLEDIYLYLKLDKEVLVLSIKLEGKVTIYRYLMLYS
jgi:hypothetical protein